MKAVLCVCDFVLVLIAPCVAISNREIQAVQAVHEAWEIAFERADIDAVENVWAHDGDVFIVTPLGTRHNGWAFVKGALKNLFALLGQTTINVSNPFLTIDGNEASMTMTYQWSLARERVFPLTERYRQVEGHWKISISDSQGQTLPLRPEDEKAIKRLTSQVQKGLIAKDTVMIADVVADDFTYTDLNGNPHEGWIASTPILVADLQRLAALQLQSIALIGAQACAFVSLTLTDGKTRNVQFIFAGPDWKLAALHLHLDRETLAVVQPKGKGTTTWGKLRRIE